MTAHPRHRRELAGLLWQLADLVQASERRRSFRARAFRAAVWALDDLSPELHDSDEEMAAVEGVGPGIIRLVDEYRRTGTLADVDRLQERFPARSAVLARLPRMTPARLEALKRGLGVDDEIDLLDAVASGAVETIGGIGPATADRWEEILSLKPAAGMVPAHDGAVAAGRLRTHLLRHLPGDTALVAGAVRRLDEWVGRIDLVVVTAEPERASRFLQETAVVASTAAEPGWAVDAITHDGLAVRVHLTDPAAVGTVMLGATGPAGHIEGIDTSHDQPTEEAAYLSVGRTWVPPPARSADGAGPGGDLVTLGHIQGDLHLHSDWSPDGHMDLDRIVEAALERGYLYLALTDHTHGLRFGGLDPAGLRRQRTAVEAARSRHPDLLLLHGAEVNIDREGRPDLDEATLAWLDFVVAGCHSHFDLHRSEQTARLVAAVRHPAVRVLAHPTGRRIGIRPGFDVDLAPVYAAAVETDTALEVNGHRDRMDLSGADAAAAVAAGARLAANGDAHRPTELDNVAVAVGVMQRGGVGAGSVVNALDLDEFAAWAGV